MSVSEKDKPFFRYGKTGYDTYFTAGEVLEHVGLYLDTGAKLAALLHEKELISDDEFLKMINGHRFDIVENPNK